MRIAIIIFSLLFHNTSYSVRAGLDFIFRVKVDGVEKIERCDICDFSFEKYGIYFQTRSVNAKDQYITLIFFYNGDRFNEEDTNKYEATGVLESTDSSLSVGMHQLVKLKEGQILTLQGYPIEIELINIDGGGCPIGSQC